MRMSLHWIALLAIALSNSYARAEEWPKWLGPQGTGISSETGLLDQWPSTGPARLWTAQVGDGFSSPVALDGKVYILGMQGSNDVLTSLDAESGKIVWQQSYQVKHKADQTQAQSEATGLPLPEATPTIDGDRIYTYGGGGDLVCRQISDGKEVWSHNILDFTGAEILPWNQASSPLVTEKLVIVQGGRTGPIALALNKQTGKVAWKSRATGMGGYAAPVLIDFNGKQELIVLGGQSLFAMNPQDGSTFWSFPWKTSYDVNAATPIYRDGRLFISSGYGHGCAMLALSEKGVRQLWESKEVGLKFQPAILDGDKVYANSGGRLKCLKWPTTTVLWKTNEIDLGEGGSILMAGTKMIALSDTGKLSLLQIGPKGPRIAGLVDLFPGTDNIWAMPMIYHGKLYVRGNDQLVCFDISSHQYGLARSIAHVRPNQCHPERSEGSGSSGAAPDPSLRSG